MIWSEAVCGFLYVACLLVCSCSPGGCEGPRRLIRILRGGGESRQECGAHFLSKDVSRKRSKSQIRSQYHKAGAYNLKHRVSFSCDISVIIHTLIYFLFYFALHTLTDICRWFFFIYNIKEGARERVKNNLIFLKIS